MTATGRHRTVASREIRLAARPQGWPRPEDFELATRTLEWPGEGEVLVSNRYMSVDPYMRGRMDARRSYAPPYEIGEPLYGGALGEVVAAHAEGLAPGDLVRSELGWREAFVAPARAVQRVDPPPGVHEAHLLGALGMPGLTAWVGLNDIADVRAGETVFVSAAAGAVGSVAGQLARERGCIVIGSAGAPEKVAYVREELGFHHAFSYRDEDPAEALAAAAPDGIDVYFDNVGGAQLEAALGAMRLHGRIVLCGAVAHYNDTEPAPGPRNLFRAVTQRLTLRGFIVRDHWDREAAFRAELDPLVAAGRLELPQAMVDGIERAPQALIDMLRGEHVGKVVVRLPGTSAR